MSDCHQKALICLEVCAEENGDPYLWEVCTIQCDMEENECMYGEPE
jgi:hypothetical protein